MKGKTFSNVDLSTQTEYNLKLLLYVFCKLFAMCGCKLLQCVVASCCYVRPDIFNFSSFKNPDRIFQEMEKKN